mgnify:CR=1 FL=1
MKEPEAVRKKGRLGFQIRRRNSKRPREAALLEQRWHLLTLLDEVNEEIVKLENQQQIGAFQSLISIKRLDLNSACKKLLKVERQLELANRAETLLRKACDESGTLPPFFPPESNEPLLRLAKSIREDPTMRASYGDHAFRLEEIAKTRQEAWNSLRRRIRALHQRSDRSGDAQTLHESTSPEDGVLSKGEHGTPDESTNKNAQLDHEDHLDQIEQLLGGQMLYLFQALRATSRYVSFDTLAEIAEVWKVQDPSDGTVKKAIERLNGKLLDTGYEVTINSRRAKLVKLSDDKIDDT